MTKFIRTLVVATALVVPSFGVAFADSPPPADSKPKTADAPKTKAKATAAADAPVAHARKHHAKAPKQPKPAADGKTP